MKATILTLASVGSVAAQVTLPPAFNVVGLSPDDAGYQTCTQAAGYLSECIESLGGSAAAATAADTDVMACACCAQSTSLAPYFSVCSEYLSDEFPRSSTQYSAYGNLYMMCSLSGSCAGGGRGSPSTTDGFVATATDSSEATITSGPSATDSAACDDMLDIYSSCAAEIDNFNRQPFRSQAACYCCRGRGNSKTWTDQLDQYAQSCVAWAKDEDPSSYSIYTGYTTFCEHFSDACDEAAATSTATDESEPSTSDAETSEETVGAADTGSSSSEDPLVPVTVTADRPEPTETGAAASVRVGAAAAVIFGAVVMVL